jgi:hypothetical protein
MSNEMETDAKVSGPTMKKLLLTLAASLMLVSAAVFAAAPSVSQIEQTMSRGDWQTADAQLTEVLQAHPESARAHYLYAQVLDREGRSADALNQVQQAKKLDPAIKFTDPSRFAATEARIQANANRAESRTDSRADSRANSVSNGNGNGTAVIRNPFNTNVVAPAAEKHGLGAGMWIGLIVVLVGLALVLRWGMRRARSNDDGKADADRRQQLKRSTELLNDVRTLKLDLRLSTQPGHEDMLKEAETIETQLRGMVEALSNSSNPVPSYTVEDLSNRLDSLRARSEGRPDPHASANAPYAPNDGQSAYAQEAERFGRGQQPQGPYSPYPPQQQPPVVVQQGGGFGGGLGGLLGGVLLGEALSGGRDRVIEREVPMDDELRRRGGNDNGGGGGGLDFGNGSNDWNDNSGGIDVGSNDSSDWDNNS